LILIVKPFFSFVFFSRRLPERAFFQKKKRKKRKQIKSAGKAENQKETE